MKHILVVTLMVLILLLPACNGIHYYPPSSGNPPPETSSPEPDCHEEVIGTTHNNRIEGGHFWYEDEYIQGGKSASLSWEADGRVSAYIFTETQFEAFKPMGIASGDMDSDRGRSGKISAEIKNADRYYFVIYNPILFTTYKVYSAEAKITWCD